MVPAKLRLPAGAGPFPAMIILHGSAGVDGRGAAMAEALARVGIASLEPDMWKARGLLGGVNGRARIISDTLPDTWGAWSYLASNPDINAAQIGVMGFSWGGAVSWITAFGLKPTLATPEVSAAKFALHVPYYGGCSSYLPDAVGGKAIARLKGKPTGAPVMYVVGTKDDYETGPDACVNLAKSYPDIPLKLRLVEGATHGFDGLKASSFKDDWAKDGKGAWVQITPDPAAAREVEREVVEFIRATFAK